MGIDFDEIERRQAEERRAGAAAQAGREPDPAPLRRATSLAPVAVAGLVIAAVAVAAVWLLVGRSTGAEEEHGPALARYLRDSGNTDWTSVTDEGRGTVAIETNLYPKPENETHARDLCAITAAALPNDDLTGLSDVRVRASDGSTLAYCPNP